MIEDLIKESFNISTTTTDSPFESDIDYDIEKEKRERYTVTWSTLSTQDREEYNNKIERYLKANDCADLKGDEAAKAKNLSLLRREIESIVGGNNNLRNLHVEELHFSLSLLELLENTENTTHIRELYRIRKRNAGKERKSGITEEEARRIKNCMRQGRELYLSGLNGPLMVKPLNFFYSLTAYSYAIIILNNPIRYALDSIPGSHGLNYLPSHYKSQVGGDIKQGTFSDLFTSFPASILQNQNIYIPSSNEESILFFHKNKITASVAILLSMVPEIREYYELATGNPSRTHPLEITHTPTPKGMNWRFSIGDGERKPSQNDISNSFGSFPIDDIHGKTVISIPSEDVNKIKATIYSDIRGNFWYIENPFFPTIFPEICLHFLLSNAFSNIMRYSPDTWGEVLLNQVSSDISLITRKYLSAFENKLPLMLLRNISKFHPSVA